MSKLAEVLKAHPTARQYTVAHPSFAGLVSVQESMAPAWLGQEYRIQATIGAMARIDQPTDDAVIKLTVHNAKRAIVEELFGEFHRPINLIREALLAGTKSDALALLSNLEDQMFKV